MAMTRTTDLLTKERETLLSEWLRELTTSGIGSDFRIAAPELRAQAEEFLKLVSEAARSGTMNVDDKAWAPVLKFLETLSRTRVTQGFRSDQTASFVFSFKKPLFAKLNQALGSDAKALAEESWAATELIDSLGLHTIRAYQKSREEVIARQQQELLELSTPVVKLWDGILALPMIGTLDSARTQVVMESLLQRIVETGSEIAIIDITGVPTVDTLVAQHLLKTVTAIRLMGADCIISGVRPQIAQTIVHLGVDLQGVTTKANLADALALALKRIGRTVTKTSA
ncbi:MAG: STAS domain-containing protein [Gemmatimonadaceae bacterium]